ncbi:hypothetical protein KDA_33490 [Dictyobacter alpinus]|uniref:HD-GYP domain-containing protein n=1 Tax=Dictyobacter alpinus TaxID=2014873 RepID=A0A402B945_9CHLR|nr:HD-GYP domain-containing protein [Dictyobacter alpinus]GCE27865.1 hypothetical protein KDA_33490 [Dictyobacter alpinus]
MLMNGTATLRCKDFLQYNIGHSLERYGCTSTLYHKDDSIATENLAYLLYAMEMAVMDTLAVWCDFATNMHAQRVVRLAEAVGTELQLSRHDLMVLRLAALLHDIGKVAIPPAILHKQGPLDSQEWTLIRLHPEMGWNILQGAGAILEQVASLVIAHHEAWNGSGYPRGLYKTDIPFLARILTVVDSYDAMVSDRVYGKPLPILSACQELVQCASHQYDPQIVLAFLSVLFGKKTTQQHGYTMFRRNPVINAPELADEECVRLLLQSAEYVRVSA